MNPTEIEDIIIKTIFSNIHNFSDMISAVESLQESYPDYPVLKFFFYRMSRLNLNENESRNLFDNIIRHCSFLSLKLEKQISFYTGMIDYLIERNRIILNPVFVELYISEKMSRMNFKDPLTSIYNQNYLEKAINSEIGRSRRKDRKFTVMILDIQKFSMINNNYGYHVGNRILLELVERIKPDMRAEDSLIRFFDDRFIIIMPETDIIGGKEFGERIFSNLMRDMIRIEGRILSLSLNIGLVEFPKHGETFERLMEQLYKMRYLSKQKGGNSIASPGGF